MHYNQEMPYCIWRAPLLLKFSGSEADTQVNPEGGTYAKTHQIIRHQNAHRNFRLDRPAGRKARHESKPVRMQSGEGCERKSCFQTKTQTTVDGECCMGGILLCIHSDCAIACLLHPAILNPPRYGVTVLLKDNKALLLDSVRRGVTFSNSKQ